MASTHKALSRKYSKLDDQEGLKLDYARPYITLQLEGFVPVLRPVDPPEWDQLFGVEMQ
jgi:hypothetical protein